MLPFLRAIVPRPVKVAARRSTVVLKKAIEPLLPRYRTVRLWPDITIRAYRDSVLSQAIQNGEFELAEQDFLRRFLREGDLFVDVGANIGLFSLIAARAVGGSGRVISFEPCRRTFERLRENVSDNNLVNVECHQLALSSEPKICQFHVSLDGFDAWNSLARPTSPGRFAIENVTAVRWDDFATRNGLVGEVTLMKVDIEGWEYQFLMGAEAVLTRPDAPILFVEFTEVNAKAAGNRCSDVFTRLEDYGYSLYHYHPDPPTLDPASNQEHFDYVNLFALKECHLDKVVERLAGTVLEKTSFPVGVDDIATSPS